MKSVLPIIAFLLFVNYGFSQKKSKVECGYFGKMTVEQRNAAFPFNQAKKVVLVAYSPNGVHIDEDGNDIKLDSLAVSKFAKVIEVVDLPSKNLNYIVTEKVALNQIQIEELSNLMLNYKIKKVSKGGLLVSPVGCYEPRNAIIFYDKGEKIVSYVEICFECHQFVQQPTETIQHFNVLGMVEECGQMIELFKDFFKKSGIHYGVDAR